MNATRQRGASLEFRLLGPVEAWHDNEKVDLGRADLATIRCLLVVLLHHPGEPVTIGRLVERTWGDHPPTEDVRDEHVEWLRSALAPYGVELVRRDDGYLIDVDPEQVDLHRFRRLVQAAEVATHVHPRQAGDLLRDALALWRGPALGGVPGTWAARLADQLNRERRDAAVARFRLDLGLVEASGLIAAPHQLPPAPRHFAGRMAEMNSLTELLDLAEPHRGAVVIVTVHGQAGIGKTALALSWAHHISDRFPDGQLFINLRGYDPSRPPIRPEEAIGELLDALGAPSDGRPASLEARVSLLRGLLSGRRVLLFFDNARTVEQVRPLLPASSSCLVVVTSRNQLHGLVAHEGAHAVPVSLLTETGAQELLSRHLGRNRVAAEPAAVDQLISQCGRLPLALAIVAARASENPDFPLALLARDLADPANRLAALEGGDVTAEVRAAFSWSYQGLSPDGRRMFRLLSSHPGARCSSYAAASIAGLAMARTRQVLGELTRTHMLEQTTPGEYEYHDLLHSYAAELTLSVDTPQERRFALHRMLDHYVRTAASAAALLNTVREPMNLPTLQPGTVPQLLDDHNQALEWFRSKRSTLVMAVELAAGNGFGHQVCDLSWALADFLDRQGHWGDLALTQELAGEAAAELGDREVQARVSRLLGRAYTQLGSYDVALEHYERACQLCVELADTVGEALAHLNLAYLQERRGHRELALSHAQRALGLYQRSGHRVGEARALNSVGWYHALLGDAERALRQCAEALAVSRELNDRHGQADALDSLGYAYRHAGQPEQAIRCYVEAIELYRGLGSRFAEASTLEYLSEVHASRAEFGPARAALEQAAEILRQLAVVDVARIEARLAELPA
jgi:tetratricopeptide (TPR) repeat protein/DNA-binding winged helix-turn-helix (wHTH) protein